MLAEIHAELYHLTTAFLPVMKKVMKILIGAAVTATCPQDQIRQVYMWLCTYITSAEAYASFLEGLLNTEPFFMNDKGQFLFEAVGFGYGMAEKTSPMCFVCAAPIQHHRCIFEPTNLHICQTRCVRICTPCRETCCPDIDAAKPITHQDAFEWLMRLDANKRKTVRFCL